MGALWIKISLKLCCSVTKSALIRKLIKEFVDHGKVKQFRGKNIRELQSIEVQIFYQDSEFATNLY